MKQPTEATKAPQEKKPKFTSIDPLDPGVAHDSKGGSYLRHTLCLECRHCAFSHDLLGCACPGCDCQAERPIDVKGFDDRNRDLQGLPPEHTKRDWRVQR